MQGIRVQNKDPHLIGVTTLLSPNLLQGPIRLLRDWGILKKLNRCPRCSPSDFFDLKDWTLKKKFLNFQQIKQ